jgi:hypothetical protein
MGIWMLKINLFEIGKWAKTESATAATHPSATAVAGPQRINLRPFGASRVCIENEANDCNTTRPVLPNTFTGVGGRLVRRRQLLAVREERIRLERKSVNP